MGRLLQWPHTLLPQRQAVLQELRVQHEGRRALSWRLQLPRRPSCLEQAAADRGARQEAMLWPHWRRLLQLTLLPRRFHLHGSWQLGILYRRWRPWQRLWWLRLCCRSRRVAISWPRLSRCRAP